MTLEQLRNFCLALPYTTENVQWGNDLLFKVGGKMYACAGLEPGKHWLSFKSSPEDFALLVEKQGVSPAKYLARAQWVSIEPQCALSSREIEQLVQKAHGLVFARLPKKTQLQLASTDTKEKLSPRRKHKRQTAS
jgi:predicted DNA-binding protein (MmcQ/YjbR family)